MTHPLLLARYNKSFQIVVLVNEYSYQVGMTLGEAWLLLLKMVPCWLCDTALPLDCYNKSFQTVNEYQQVGMTLGEALLQL